MIVHNPLKSKTFWGALIYAVAKVVVSPDPATIVEALGIVLTAVGLRDAVSKVGKKVDKVEDKVDSAS